MLKNLKAEMARSGVTNRAVAKAIDVSEESISNWLNAKRGKGFSVSQATKVRDTFFPEMTLDYLFAQDES